MNRYAELKQRQQKEINALPLGFAYSNQQFSEMMKNWGLDPEKDTDKIYRLPGGGFIQKKDHALLHETLDRQDEELQAAIAADDTGEGFIYEMFRTELDDHEFGYTKDTESTLDALGYTAAEVLDNPRLKRGLEKAVAEICSRHGES